MLSTRTLAKIAAYGGVIVASTGFFLHWKLQDNIKKEEFHREAMKVLRNHTPSVLLLGEPIKAGNIDLGNRTINFCDGTNAKLEVPVKGPKSKGTLYFWAVKDEIEHKWCIRRMELGLKNDPDRRLLVIDDQKKIE